MGATFSKGFYSYSVLGFHITDDLSGRRLTGHAGQSYGLVSSMYFDRDENTGVIVMINGGNYQYSESGFTGIEEAVVNLLFDKLSDNTENSPKIIKILNKDGLLAVKGKSNCTRYN